MCGWWLNELFARALRSKDTTTTTIYHHLLLLILLVLPSHLVAGWLAADLDRAALVQHRFCTIIVEWIVGALEL